MPEKIDPINIEELQEGAVYLALYPKWTGILKGEYPFTVTKLGRHHVYVMFYYPVRDERGNETLTGDEPAILMQSPKTRVWKHYGANIGDVPIVVGRLEGKRLTKHNQDQQYRREWLKTHTLPATEYPMGTGHIEGIERLIRTQLQAEGLE
jgi:hypothetical protein